MDEWTSQYYYHAFLREQQPNLNWHIQKVRRAFADVRGFWLQRGMDGFRLDASAVLAEDPLLRDEAPIRISTMKGRRRGWSAFSPTPARKR